MSVRTSVRVRITASAFALPVCAVGAVAADHPSPGEYQVDSETVMTTRAGPVVQRVVTAVRGDTGATVVTRSSSLDAQPVVSTYPGTGPVLQCVRAGAAPMPSGECRADMPGAAGSKGLAPYCAPTGAAIVTGGQSPAWRQLGPQLWELRRSYRGGTAMPSAPAPDPSAILKSPMFASLPAAEREALRAELAQQQTDRTVSAQHAAGVAGQGQSGVTWEITQRWTGKGRTCSR